MKKRSLTRFSAAVLAIIFLFPPLKAGASVSVSAECAILINASDGRVLYEKNADKIRSMASTTKIMTGLIACEYGDLERTVRVADQAVGVEGSSIYLYKGEELTAQQLLYAVMLQSANDASAALAIDIGGSIEGFAGLMNQKAAEIGLTSTSYANPHGLDAEGHYTTARDLARLTVYALNNEMFKTVVSTYKLKIPMQNGSGIRLLVNHNRLLRTYEGAIGVKTGYTRSSGRCLVTAAERNGVRLVAVTLNAPDDWRDHTNMLDYGFSAVERIELCKESDIKGKVPVVGGEQEFAEYSVKSDVSVDLPRGEHSIRSVTEMSRFLYAPIAEGEVIGRAVWYDGDTEIASCDLVANSTVEKKKYKMSFFEWLISLFS